MNQRNKMEIQDVVYKVQLENSSKHNLMNTNKMLIKIMKVKFLDC